MSKLELGFTACYINDYKFCHLAEIPAEAALAWAKAATPNSRCYVDKTTFKDLEDQEHWLNKLFVIVDKTHDKWIAIYNHDGKFHIRTRMLGELE